jgi:tricorn protease
MRIRFALLIGCMLVFSGMAMAAEDAPLLATEPKVNNSEIVFVYGGYLWSVPREGGEARQLTTGGHQSSPAFSPHGEWIAFAGEYDGNRDVYVMRASGGEPKRLTWHPALDAPVGWTRDGKRILFVSARDAYADITRLYTVPAQGEL